MKTYKDFISEETLLIEAAFLPPQGVPRWVYKISSFRDFERAFDEIIQSGVEIPLAYYYLTWRNETDLKNLSGFLLQNVDSNILTELLWSSFDFSKDIERSSDRYFYMSRIVQMLLDIKLKNGAIAGEWYRRAESINDMRSLELLRPLFKRSRTRIDNNPGHKSPDPDETFLGGVFSSFTGRKAKDW